MAKLHSIAKKLGFKSNEDFYKKFPTKAHYEFAMGGTMKYPEGGMTPTTNAGLVPIRPGDVQNTQGIYYAPTATPDANFMDPTWSGATVIPRTTTSAPATTTPGYQYQYQNPAIQQKMAQNRGFDTTAAWMASGKDPAMISKISAYNASNPFKKKGGAITVFPQIQTEKGFFSRSYENVDAPYTNGSFKLGGYAGFGEGHPFPYQPRMPKNGKEAFGVPTRPTILAQYGGMSNAVQDNNVYDATMDAMGNPDYLETDIFNNDIDAYTGKVTPKKPLDPNYQWPIAPDVPAGPMNFPMPGAMSTMNTSFSNPYMNPNKKMGGSKKKPCYNCGGGYTASMKSGGNSKGTIADFNQGSEYFTNKLNKFTEGLRDTATQVTLTEMNQMIPPGYSMGGGTGYPEMFPYAMPYQYAGGGENWIQNAVNPAHKGYCTPMSKKTCTPRRKAFAMTMKKHHGFHKQEGGTPDPAQEAKWQAIIDLTNQGITDPGQIAATLNDEGIYQTDPNEVAGYLQEYSQEQGTDYAKYGGIPKAQDGWDFTPDYRKSEKINQLRSAVEKKRGISLKGVSDEQVIKMGIDSSLISKGEIDNKAGYDPYGQNSYGNYMQNPGFGTGWPGGTYKVNNKFNFYGNPNDTFSAPQRTAVSAASNSEVIDPAKAKMLKDAGMWYKQDIKNDIWSRIGLANGPKRIHTEFGFGDQPYMGLPQDSGTGTTWAGDQLRKLTGPSKKKQARLAEEEQYLANKANQDSNAFALQQYQNEILNQKLPLGPQYQGAFGPSGIPTFSTEQSQVPTSQSPSWDELNQNYQKAVEERDRVFKEHNINKKGKHRNILGIKYQEGGSQYVKVSPSSADPISLLKFNPNEYNMDPNMDPENLPGYIPQPALSNTEMVKATEGNPADQLGSGFSASSDAVRKQAGEADFWKDINAMNMFSNLFNQPHNKRLEEENKKRQKALALGESRQDRDRGDYTTNYGYFRPDQQNAGNMVTGKWGGTYQEGGQYDLTGEQIQMLRDRGYDIEILD